MIYSQQQCGDMIGVSRNKIRTVIACAQYANEPIPGFENNSISDSTLEWLKGKCQCAKDVAPAHLQATTTASGGEKVECSNEESSDSRVLTTKSENIKTLEDLLIYAKVDMTVWIVEKHIVNSWMMGYKNSNGEADSHMLFQVKAWLKRVVSKVTENVINELMDRATQYHPIYAPIVHSHQNDPHMLEVSIYDHHMGKLAWQPETGENYDLRISEELYEKAVHDLVSKANGFNIEEIVFPFGQDFFNFDNLQGMTANGTPQDNDGRLQKVIVAGQMATVRVIDYLRTVAPVTILWVPGNHDFITSWHSANFLNAWYRDDTDVTVDDSPIQRKYYSYGVNLIGYTHGDGIKLDNLPLILATAVPDLWAQCPYREMHTGHVHRQREVKYVSVDDSQGVIVRTLPSLSGKDRWIYSKGYLANRMAEAIIYSRDRGLSGTVFTTGK